MSPKLSPTPAIPFSKTFDQRLKLYSVTAAAAGVSILALAQPSNAEVVITRKTIPLNPVNNVFTSIPVDVDRDGIADFSFSINDYFVHSHSIRIGIVPLQGGAVVGTPAVHAPAYASNLMRGAKIGHSARFSSKGFAEVERSFIPYAPSQYERLLYGEWGGNSSNRYVGIRFLINGKTHYGWVRLSVDATQFPLSGTITGYAYETVANKPIVAGIAPAPAVKDTAAVEAPQSKGPSLGMLAAGAEAMPVWRRAN